MKVLILICSIVIFLSACEDDTYHTVVRGKVVNRGSGEPIADAKVTLKDGVGAVVFGQSSNTSSDKMVEVYSDQSGEFEISLKGEHTAFMGASKEKYNCFQVEGRRSSCDEVVPFGDGERSDIIVTLDAHSFVKAKFYSPEAVDGDLLKIQVINWISDYKNGGGGTLLW